MLFMVFAKFDYMSCVHRVLLSNIYLCLTFYNVSNGASYITLFDQEHQVILKSMKSGLLPKLRDFTY